MNSRYKLCFDLEKDYDENGNIKPEVTGMKVPFSSNLMELHKHSCFDPDSRASVKAYALKWKKECQK